MKNRLLTIGIALLSLSRAAQAAPIFSAALGLNNTCASNIQPTTSSAPIVITANWTCGISPLFLSGTAVAGPGTMGLSASGVNATTVPGNPAFATAHGSFSANGVITGPAGGPAFVPVSMNLHITGSTALTGGNTAWSMQLSSSMFGQGTLESGPGGGAGMLAGLPNAANVQINSTIATATVMLQVGQTVPYDLGWIVRVNAGSPGSTAAIDFLNTLAFPASGPVFNLPDGHTINIPDFNVFDNRYLPAGTASNVPEPASMALTGAALAAAGLLRLARAGLIRKETAPR